MPAAWLDGLRDGLEALRTAVGLYGDVSKHLPDGVQKREADRNLERADRDLRLAEARVAQALGHKLCQCTFPPQIMVLAGTDEEAAYLDRADFFACPACGREEPSKKTRRTGSVVAWATSHLR